MHDYSELITRCTSFTLDSLNEVNEKTIKMLETSGATTLVKTLQMVQLQKTIMAIGMFSLFEAMLQDELECINGFTTIKKILKDHNYLDLSEKFSDLYLAINVLKHGEGESYNKLIRKNGGTVKNHIKVLNVEKYEEGDVSEINTLIGVDDDFIKYCSEIIEQVSRVVHKIKYEREM